MVVACIGAASEITETVRPLRASALVPREGTPPSARLVEAYHASILRWGRIVAERVRPVPGREAMRYLGLPGNHEDHIRPTAYAALVLAFLAEFHLPRQVPDEIDRPRYLPNQRAAETAEWAERVSLVADGCKATCALGEQRFAAAFPQPRHGDDDIVD